MRKILALLRRDLISTTRDSMLLYIVLAPIIMGLAIRLFLPAVGTASINLVITEADAPLLQDRLSPYAHVNIVADAAALDRRVMGLDDAAGIVIDETGSYEVILQGNETADSAILPELALAHAFGEQLVNAEIQQVRGTSVPYRDWIGAFLGLSVPFIASIAMAMFIIEDKESRMLQAMSVTPLKKGAYVLARGLFVMGYCMVMVYLSLLALGISGAPVLPILAMTLSTSSAAILFGFVVGSLSSTQVAGLANMKFGFMVVLLPGILSLVLPSQYHVGLYWIPFFWAFKGFESILVQGSDWTIWWPSLLWTVVTTAVFIAAAAPWLKKRLVAAN